LWHTRNQYRIRQNSRFERDQEGAVRVLWRRMDGARLLVLTGELDRTDEAPIADLLRANESRAHQIALVDLSELGFADSTILTLIYDLIRDRPDGSWLGLIAPSVDLKRMLACSSSETWRAPASPRDS
jgi:ABC-type transporter Mla MlaB component